MNSIPIKARPIVGGGRLNAIAENLQGQESLSESDATIIAANLAGLLDEIANLDASGTRLALASRIPHLAPILSGTGRIGGPDVLPLASALAEISASTGPHGRVFARARRLSFQKLIRGTSFDTENVSASVPELQSILSLYAENIRQKIHGTRLIELWDVLLEASFYPEEELFGPSAIDPREARPEIGVDDFASGDEDSCGWSFPSVFLGCLWQRFSCYPFILPSGAFLPFDGLPRGEMSNGFASLLRGQGWDGGPRLPSYRNGNKGGRQWLTLSVRQPVFLSVRPDDLGIPDVRIEIGPSWEDVPVCFFSDNDFLLQDVEESYSDNIEVRDIVSAIYTHGEAKFLGAPVLSVAGNACALYDGRIKRAESVYLDYGDSGWLGALSPLLQRLMAGGDHRFFSVLACDGRDPVPCNDNSVAAALLRNASLQEPSLRLDHILTERAREISETGLQFYERTYRRYEGLLSPAVAPRKRVRKKG